MSSSKSADTAGNNGSKLSPLGLITEKQQPVSIKSVKVDVHITGYVAEVSSRLKYFNKEKTPVDIVFRFPTNEGSAVFHLEADIGKRHIVTDVQRKEQVELTAKDAEKHGKTALLYKEDNSAQGIFSCMLGNLPAQSEASLLMKYVIELQQEADGRLRFTLPTVLNPRHLPGSEGEIAAKGATYVPLSKVPYEFRMTAIVEGNHKVTSVTSDRVKLDVNYENDNKIAKVSVGGDFKFDHNLQLLVQYEEPYTPQIILENGNPKADGLMKEDICMVSFQPDLKKVSMATSGEYIFVIERSRRMTKNDIENAKKALLLFLKSLPADCYFNIISFGSKINSLFRSSKKYTESTLKDAFKLHEKMKADMEGGEILKPLEHIFGKNIIVGHPRRVFVLAFADDAVNRKQKKYTSVHELVKSHSQSTCTRVFTLGFGVPNTLLTGIADSGGGKAEFITGQERIQPKVISLLKCAMQPAIMNITLSWNLPKGVTTAFIPPVLPTVFSAGERFTLYAILQGVDKKAVHAPSTVTLKGQQDGKSVSHSMTFTLCKTDDINTSAPVHRLATKFEIELAQAKEASCFAIDHGIDSLEEDCNAIYKLRQKTIVLSLHGNIVSKYTCFVAKDAKGKTVENKIVQRSNPMPVMSEQFNRGIQKSMMRDNLCDFDLLDLEEELITRKERYKKIVEEKKRATVRKSIRNSDFSLMGKASNKLNGRGLSQRYDNSEISVQGHFRRSDEPTDDQAVSAAVCADDAVSVVDDDELMTVIFLQHFCGQWIMTKELLDLLQFSKEDMEMLDFSKDPSIVCTVIVLSWLWKQYSHRQEEWEMIENKALSWMSSKNLNTPTEDIIQQTTQTLWVK